MNAKISKVVDVIITVCNVLTIVAQAVKSAFPAKKDGSVRDLVKNGDISAAEAKVIADFLKEEMK